MSTKRKNKAAVEAPSSETAIHSIKGLNRDFTCRGLKFEVGKTYSIEGPIKACTRGFHACPIDEHPFSVLEYYGFANSRFVEAVQSGAKDRVGNKLASASITIGVELSIDDLVARAIKWVFERSKTKGASATGDSGAASATGWGGAPSATGWGGAASATGDSGAASATGWRGAASATGDSGAASATGWGGAASATGWGGAASATGGSGAASATGWGGAASATGGSGAASATGGRGAASATGWSGAASATGERGAASATGQHSIAMSVGILARAMATDTNAICLACRDKNTGEILAIRASKCGENGIESGVYYMLNAAGEFVKGE